MNRTVWLLLCQWACTQQWRSAAAQWTIQVESPWAHTPANALHCLGTQVFYKLRYHRKTTMRGKRMGEGPYKIRIGTEHSWEWIMGHRVVNNSGGGANRKVMDLSVRRERAVTAMLFIFHFETMHLSWNIHDPAEYFILCVLECQWVCCLSVFISTHTRSKRVHCVIPAVWQWNCKIFVLQVGII